MTNGGQKKVVIIGAGFAGLAAACCLAKEGMEVVVLEKNSSTGGRARHFSENGFMFDMGPSWYWMPDVFDNFFALFNKKTSDFYELKRLDPGYTIHFGNQDTMQVPDKETDIYALFESLEKGAAAKLKKFMESAEIKYKISMEDLVFKPSISITEFFQLKVFKSLFSLNLFESFSKYVRRYFKHPQLIQLLEFPILFLGAKPENTPALYSMMNYAGLFTGTYYPMGGMCKIPEAIEKLAVSLGVTIITDAPATKIEVIKDKAKGVWVGDTFHRAHVVISAADYEFTESKLLEPEYRNYTDTYWNTRVMAPSALIYYLGIDKKINTLQHHTLFFDADFKVHAHEIYADPKWPANPLFYVCAPSVTDPAVAPAGKENLFILVPIASGMQDSDAERENHYEKIMDRLEKFTNTEIKNHVIYKRSYCLNDFKSDYNAFKGNAYGLANTLKQTAILKPGIKNKKVSNLFYTGQLTVPGPGVPPSLISAQIVSKQVANLLNEKK